MPRTPSMIGMPFISKSLISLLLQDECRSQHYLRCSLLMTHCKFYFIHKSTPDFIPDIRTIVNNNQNLQITNNNESNRSEIILIYLQQDCLFDSSSHLSISQSITHFHSRLSRILGSESNFVFLHENETLSRFM